MKQPKSPEAGCALVLVALIGALCGFFGVMMVVGGSQMHGERGFRSDQVPIGFVMAALPLVMLGIMALIVHKNQLSMAALRWPIAIVLLGWVLGILAPNHLEPIIKSIWNLFRT